jgi:hypothetical protein
MTRFEDGPAKGQVLTLRRAAIFLRVVRDENGAWDALDQLDDTAKPDETLFAYQCVGNIGSAFIDGKDPVTGRRMGYRAMIASYRFVPDQPTDAEMRSTFGWQKWCQAEAERQHLDKVQKEQKP